MGVSGSKLTPEAIQSLQEQTQFDKREITAWHNSFREEVPKGAITRDHLRLLFRSFFPFGDATKFAELLFRLFTLSTPDSPETITYGTYLTALSLASRGKTEEKIKMSFRFYDVDGDGKISRSDLLTVVQAVAEMTVGMVEDDAGGESVEQRVDSILRRLDSECVTYEQFRKAFHEDPNLLQGLIIYDGLV